MTLFRPSSGTLKLGPSSATTPFSDGVLIAQMAGYRASDRQVGVKISGCNFSNDSKVLRCVYPCTLTAKSWRLRFRHGLWNDAPRPCRAEIASHLRDKKERQKRVRMGDHGARRRRDPAFPGAAGLPQRVPSLVMVSPAKCTPTHMFKALLRKLQPQP